MTPQELKNSILQLAIQGKLVEQRPEEGTAEELFAQIQEEKQRLIAEKKIKKEKPLPEITEEEKPFEIPESWKWVRLKQVTSILYGYPFDSGQFNELNQGIPLIRIRDILLGTTKTFTTEEAPDKYLVNSGDMIVGMDGNFNVRVWGENPAYLNQRVCKISANSSYLMQEFLYYYLPKALAWISQTVSFVTVKHLSDKHLTLLLVPLPPVAEQKRIVSKIKELLPYIDRYERAWNKLEQFNSRFPEDMKKSLLQYAIQGKLVEQRPEEGTAEELFAQIQEEKQRLIAEKKIKKGKPLAEITEDEKPFEIPESWKWVRIGNMFNVGTGMTPLKSENRFYQNGTIPWVTSSLTSRRFITATETSITEYALENTSLTVYPAHTLIVAMYGQGKTRGQVSELLIDATINQACAALGNIIKNQILTSYTYFFFLFNYELLRKKAEGTSQPNLNLNKIKEIPMPLPPLAEQKRIVEKLEQLLPLCERLK